jgi:hypothetical protein
MDAASVLSTDGISWFSGCYKAAENAVSSRVSSVVESLSLSNILTSRDVDSELSERFVHDAEEEWTEISLDETSRDLSEVSREDPDIENSIEMPVHRGMEIEGRISIPKKVNGCFNRIFCGVPVGADSYCSEMENQLGKIWGFYSFLKSRFRVFLGAKMRFLIRVFAENRKDFVYSCHLTKRNDAE